MVWKPPKYPPTHWKIGKISHLSSLLYDMKHTHTLAKWNPKAQGVGEGYLPQQPYGSIYSENQKTRIPLRGKRKITTNEG
jgi:hypothetical protein